jgi:hypothetical protein
VIVALLVLLPAVAPAPRPELTLRLEVTVGGKPAEAAWAAFLDELFTYHDRNGDGTLSPAEAARVVPLPLPGGKTLSFAGRFTRVALRERCRRGGFGPVVVVVEGPSDDDERLAAVFAARLPHGREAFRRDDLSEDEYLEASELLASAGPAPPRGPSAVIVDPRGKPLRLDVGAAVRVERVGDHRVTVRPTRNLPDMRSASTFLSVLLGEGAALTKEDIDGDPVLTGLAVLFDHADRDGDGKLTLAELEAYLKLVEHGVASQVWVTVKDRGRNPFAALDADGDGRLSLREMAAADRRLPRQFEVYPSAPAVKLWGGVRVPAVQRRKAVVERKEEGPAWFQAMDVNGDGVVSRREWLGPPEAFRKLDADGDGLITPKEAGR